MYPLKSCAGAFMFGCGTIPIRVQEIKSQILKIMNGENEAHKLVAHKTVISSLLASDLPPEELSVTRIQDEAVAIVGAGIETVKAVLALACFHILENPEVLRILREELIDAFPDLQNPPTLSELERLPYLTAIIQEGESKHCGTSPL